MWISHRNEIQKLTFRALALRRSESTKGWRSERQLLNPFMVANSRYQLSW